MFQGVLGPSLAGKRPKTETQIYMLFPNISPTQSISGPEALLRNLGSGFRRPSRPGPSPIGLQARQDGGGLRPPRFRAHLLGT